MDPLEIRFILSDERIWYGFGRQQVKVDAAVRLALAGEVLLTSPQTQMM